MFRSFARLAATAGARGALATAAPARGLKQTTGIVGLPVVEDARGVLSLRLGELKEAVSAVPASAEYRVQVEKTANYKLDLLTKEADDEVVESVLGRQLEEEIYLADKELSLIPRMLEWKPWEVPEGYKVEILEEREIVHEQAEAK